MGKLKMLKFYDAELNCRSISMKLCIMPENLMQRYIRYLVLIVPVYDFLLFMMFMLVYVTLELRELMILFNQNYRSHWKMFVK